MGIKGDRVRSLTEIKTLMTQHLVESLLFGWKIKICCYIFVDCRVKLVCLGPVERMVLRVLKAELGPLVNLVLLVLLEKR